MKSPNVSIDVLVIRDNKILLGLMTEQWNYEGKQVYGVPGREIYFNEKKVLLPDDWVKWEWFEKDAIPDNLFPATKNLIDSYL